ncbi:signal transduction histidine kinase/ligand-binding sensor domain-containing protein/DNA-binding response OmpR family regulator [Parabacteroides sp. PFB2-10]|uniref:hybrid sensor histidine kinase/response regulator transcription factor n=1 Tax=Parabacteroides sp. PFB2-10 TaxID=1742405 RepID=UPI002477208F|nr:hybrid sensor histidine kinase/response regulator transcription factor [Parabacteroides sp. PFB2-10]MDH6313930.1 signal transduction histidine kinase/ligand-binding sensor domain-containing protein/DNA-binding response OmpR family regulator [Parabacteroides sp. PFB2-10]
MSACFRMFATMKCLRSIVVYALLFSCLMNHEALRAQNNPNKYNYKFLTIRDGLCDNSIRAIHKDSNSFMWFGTSNGLDRYDGYDLKHYSTTSSSSRLFMESNYINDIKEDEQANLWIASEAGITRINLLQENIDYFKDYAGENQEVLSTPVKSILIDDWGNLWIGKSDCLAYAVVNEEREIEEIHLLKEEVDIRTIVKYGNEIWAGGTGCLFRFAASTKGNYMSMPVQMDIDSSRLTFNCLFSYGDYLWLGTQNGLYCYNIQSQFYSLYQHDPRDVNSISSNYITDIDKNSSGDIIIGTRNGVNIYLRNDQFATFQKGAQARSLNDNVVNRVFVDENNDIWVGTDFGGINIMTPQRISFSHELQGYEKGTPHIISTVLEDREGNVLAGIVDGGLAIKRKGSSGFRFYTHNPAHARSLAHNNISKIVQDRQGDYWISTIGGGVDKLLKQHLSDPVFEHYNTSNSGLLSNEIYDMALDTVRNSLWMCSSNQIHTFHFSTGVINRLQYYTRSNETISHMNTIFIDSQSRLWIGGNGIYIIDLKNSKEGYECIYYPYKLNDPESKINEKINCIIETKSKDIFLGSLGNGIYLLDKNSPYGEYTFQNFAVRSGLSDASISNIIDDENGNLWISTLKGIYFFDTNTYRAVKFDEGDGLQVQQFYKRAGCRSTDHTILLGSIDGLVSFSPSVNIPKQKDRVVTLTSVVVDGNELTPYLNSEQMNVAISNAEELHLYPPQNSFELTFSSLDYTEQEKIFYFHRILELKERANAGLKKRHAKYTNLTPGKYTLQVWCTNYDNTWSSTSTYLTIVVHPPFYKTIWFYSLMGLLGLSILLYLLYWYNRRQKNIQQLLKEKIDERTQELNTTISELTDSQAIIVEQNEQLLLRNEEINQQKNELVDLSQQMEAINKEKLSYFTNLTHEFKTPLTLIQGPTTQLIKQATNQEQKENLLIVNRNARYLLSLVNQLIDLRKIDAKNLTLNFTQFDFTKFLNYTIMDFSSLMKERGITFENTYRLKSDHIYSDKENLHKVLFNLLSNAIKYTPDHGKITLRVSQFPHKETGKLLQYISVTNSGSLIAQEEIDKIFQLFYRISDQHKYTNWGQSSTGIGLHIVKEIITLLGGTIKVKSSERIGVSFRIYFPVVLSDSVENETDQEPKEPIFNDDKIEPFIAIDRDKPTLLLVEDNPDMRYYIRNMLKEKYNVAEANNGEMGYRMAQQIIPDFIVSDLMMPVCDGADFCRMIRKDERLCHIPFLLLTANSSETARIESYENGVDGFVTKPFEQSVLLAHIDAILKNRNLRQKKFVEEDLNLSHLEVGHSDQQFMKEVMDILEKNYADPEFGVKELAEKLHISYTLIYKKFISLTGLPPVRFILLYRLQLAKKILENSKNNNIIVSEIAYRVGFNDPKYFSRCFVKQYKITPSSMIR